MKKYYKRSFSVIGVGIVFLIVSFFFDNIIFNWVDIIKNPILDRFFVAGSHFSSIIWVLIVMTSLFMWENKKPGWIVPLVASFVIAAVLGIMIKILIARPRPFGVEFMFFYGLVNYSFPSTHATAVFAPIKVLHREYPKLQWFWVIFATIVAFSRIYLKFHYLSDVIAGAVIGYLVGTIIMYYTDKYKLNLFYDKLMDIILKPINRFF